jgi:hypothetical protein
VLQTCRAVNTTAQATTLVRVFLEDLIVVDIVSKFSTIYGNRNAIILNINNRYTIIIKILPLHHLFTDQFYCYLFLPMPSYAEVSFFSGVKAVNEKCGRRTPRFKAIENKTRH